MNLTASKRAGETKSATKHARREGKIPAVFYSCENPGESIELDALEFDAILRQVKPNHLSTTIFTLKFEGKSIKAIVKGVQYHRTSYKVLHLDFEELKDNMPVKVKVPIEFVGIADCVGIKLGGFLRPIVRNVKVKCLPKDIPSQFELDITDMKIKQSKRLSDIPMPQGVETLTVTDEVVVVIAKR